MAKVGFIGLGTMGGNMVDRLLSKGHAVTGYNRTRAKAQWLLDKGMQWADSPRAGTPRLPISSSQWSRMRLRPPPSLKVPMACWRD